jgi:hypothetical protein
MSKMIASAKIGETLNPQIVALAKLGLTDAEIEQVLADDRLSSFCTKSKCTNLNSKICVICLLTNSTECGIIRVSRGEELLP